MTGFGAAEGEVSGRRLRVEIRTVNHRWFNFAARLPGDLAPFEAPIRERMRKEFARGHVTVGVRWAGDAGVDASLDIARAATVVDALRALKERFGLAGDISVDLVARHANLIGVGGDGGEAAAEWDAIEPIVAGAAGACRAEREREGQVLADELLGRLDELDAAARRVAGRAPQRLERERQRLQENLALLLDGRAADQQRVAQELAVAADRLDITEELVRLDAHLRAARQALVGAGAGPVGKQLGFLAQEMGREINTIGAKANDAAIAHDVVFMKSELERFREQLENLE